MIRLARRTQGFTLLEVLVGLVIGSVALGGAAALFVGLSGHVDLVAEASFRTDRDANAERLLRSLVSSAHLGGEEGFPLEGDEREVRFLSWCQPPDRWPTPCSVRLTVPVRGELAAVVLEATAPGGPSAGVPVAGTSIELWSGLRTGRILYLVRGSDGGQWTDRWSDRGLPAAVGLVLDRDTLVLSLGRGG